MVIRQQFNPSKKTYAYDQDFQAWAMAQAEFLKQKAWDHLDLEHLIEEVESLGRQQRQELRNRLAILLGHLLKWEFQPEKRSRSWLATIRVQRRDLQQLLKENPSLKSYLEEAIPLGYENGRDLASGETDLPLQVFPVSCPYAVEQIFDLAFYPGEPSSLIEENIEN